MNGIVCAGHWVLDHIKFIDNLIQKNGIESLDISLLRILTNKP